MAPQKDLFKINAPDVGEVTHVSVLGEQHALDHEAALVMKRAAHMSQTSCC